MQNGGVLLAWWWCIVLTEMPAWKIFKLVRVGSSQAYLRAFAHPSVSEACTHACTPYLPGTRPNGTVPHFLVIAGTLTSVICDLFAPHLSRLHETRVAMGGLEGARSAPERALR